MGILTVNGLDAIRGSFRLPRIGRWTTDLKIDSETALSGAAAVSINDGEVVFNGTVVPSRSGEFVDLASARILAGANGLQNPARAKHYNSTSAGLIITDIMRDTGETLSKSADASVTGFDLDAWTSVAIPAGRIFRRLLSRVGSDVAWRTLPDGSVWVGRETWPDSGFTADDFDILEQDDEQGFTVLGIDGAPPMPGTTLLGRQISYVALEITDVIRAKVWYEDPGATRDRFKAAVDGGVDSALPDIDYGALYTARIISQKGGTADLQPDDSRLPTMAQVTLNLGLPGASANGAAEGRVLVGWSGRDPSRPFALSFDPSNQVATLLLAVQTMLTLGATLGAEPLMKAITTNAAWSTFAGIFATYLAAIKTTADPTGLATPPMLAGLTAFTAALAKAGTLLVEGA